MNNLPKLWTEKEVEILKEQYPKLGLMKTAELLNVSSNRVRGKVDKLGLKTFAKKLSSWTIEQENFLLEHYENYGASKCSEILKKSKSAICSKASRLGLTKNIQWTYIDEEFLINNYKIKGPDYCAIKLNKSKSSIIQQAHRKNLKTDKINKRYSFIALEWLDSFNNSNILHAENGGEQTIAGYKVDGYDPLTNIVYEFHGDVFHGNLDIFKPNEYCNPFDHRHTAEELWIKTYERMFLISKISTLIYIWENDYKKGKNAEQF